MSPGRAIVLGAVSGLLLSMAALGEPEAADAATDRVFTTADLARLVEPSDTEPSGDAIEGGVVALAGWNADRPASGRAVAALGSIAYAFDGVRTVVIARSEEDTRRVGLLAPRVEVLRDADDSFAALLDGDASAAPSIWVFGRCGRLRAVPESGAVFTEMRRLIAESREEAEAAEPYAVRNRPAVPVADDEPPAGVGSPDELFAITPDAVDRPSEEAYAGASWPDANTSPLSAKNLQGEPLPEPGLDRGEWLTHEPAVRLDERVLVLDFWATWCGPCIAAAPGLERAQREHDGRIQVIGVSGLNDTREDVLAHLKRNPSEVLHRFDGQNTLLNAMQVRGIPHVAIVSTDGVVRWQGHPGVPGFGAALAEVVRADPLLRSLHGESPETEPRTLPYPDQPQDLEFNPAGTASGG